MTLTKKYQIFKFNDVDVFENTKIYEIKLKKCFDGVEYDTEEIAEKALEKIIESNEVYTILSIYTI